MNEPQPTDECTLIEKLKQGDFEAFDVVYKRYFEGTRRFLGSLSADDVWADDALQEVFIRLYRMRDRLQPEQSLKSLLYVIAKNLYLSEFRRKRGAPTAQPDRLFEGIRANSRIEPEVCLIDAYRKHCIRRAIASLPPNLLIVFTLSHYEDMRYEEIAEVLSIPLGTVKSRMSNAMKHLRQVLKEDL